MQLQLYDVTVGETRHGPVASCVFFAAVDILENPAGLWRRGGEVEQKHHDPSDIRKTERNVSGPWLVATRFRLDHDLE
jgi:hypothetical protein